MGKGDEHDINDKIEGEFDVSVGPGDGPANLQSYPHGPDFNSRNCLCPLSTSPSGLPLPDLSEGGAATVWVEGMRSHSISRPGQQQEEEEAEEDEESQEEEDDGEYSVLSVLSLSPSAHWWLGMDAQRWSQLFLP
jgi:hypothetical protein